MATRLITADTSVVVPGLGTWHEAHGVCAPALRGVTRLPAHVLLESTAVLTRLPGGRAVSATDVVDVLATEFPGEPLCLAPREHRELLAEFARARLVGGAFYDALVGTSARRAGAVLRTRDERASRTYAVLGVDVEMVG